MVLNARRGGEAATQAAKKSGGGSFRRYEYLQLDEGEKIVLRYLYESPDWFFMDQHASAPTKNKPAGHDGKWPETMPAICRYDPAFTDEQGVAQYTDCYICDAELTNKWGRPCKPTVRVWLVACVREEVVGTKEMLAAGEISEDQVGKRLGYKDAMREVKVRNEKGEETGETALERRLVIVNQAPSNYTEGLQACYEAYDKTNCDRDYIVKCSGSGKDKDFNHMPLEPTPNLKPGTERWARYEESMKEQGLDVEGLGKIIAERASDEYFARFFDPTKTVESKKDGESSKGETPAPEAPAKSNDVDEDKLKSMKERIRSRGTAAMADVD